MRKFIVISIVLLTLAGFAITSLAQEPMVVDLLAGQTIKVGTLTVGVVGSDLVVTYNIDPEDPEEGWELLETHLYVGYTNPEELTSAPGQFPYSEEHDHAVLTFTYTIPIDDINSYSLKGGKKWVVDEEAVIGPDDRIYIAAQAEIGMIDEDGNPVLDPPPPEEGGEQIEETAWAEGTEIRLGKNWAMYFQFPEVAPGPS